MKSTQALWKSDSIQMKNESHQIQTSKSILNKTNQIQITQKQKTKIVNIFQLYKYADKIDYLLILIGIALSAGTGCGLPFFAVVAGDMVDAFQQINDQMTTKTATARNQFLYIGAATFFAAFLSVITWMKVGERISLKCRKLYLQSILKKNPKDSDEFKKAKVIQEMQSDFLTFRQALGYKVGSFIFIAASLIAGGRNAISTGWLLSLIMVSTLPLLGISGVLYTFFVQLKKNKFQKCYHEAEKRSLQILLNLKNTKMLNSQKYELSVYNKLSTFLTKKILLFSSFVALSSGWFSLVQFGVYALAFWFGSHCVQGTQPCQNHDQNDRYTPGAVIVIFFAFYVRLDSMQQILPTLRKIYAGMQAGYKIYEVIENCKDEDIQNVELKEQFSKVIFQGCIEFQKVSIYEDKDYNVKMLDQISFKLDEKLVGFQGDKRQLIRIRDLMMGFEQANEGNIIMDGNDMSKINKKQLFKSIGFISQQSGLVDSTINNNLNYDLKYQQEQIQLLLKEFNFENLIDQSNYKYQNFIGYQGSQLSYKDKRKILLIRVLLKKPKIIVIDQILKPGMEQQEKQIFNKLIQLSVQTNHLIYFGQNPLIIKTLPVCHKVKNGKIQEMDLSQSLCPIRLDQQLDTELCKNKNIFLVQKSYKNTFRKSPQITELKKQKELLKLYSVQFMIRLIPKFKQFKTLFSLGLFFSFLCGILYPIFTIFLADILLQTFKFKDQNQQSSFIRQNIQKPVLVIVYIGISSFVFNFIENIIFSILSQKIKHQIRTESYQKLINLPLQWYFQNSLHQPYKVAKNLKQNGTEIGSFLTGYVPIVFKNIISMISGLIIAFIFLWRSALLGFITLPMMMASGFLLMKYFNQNDSKTKNKYKQSFSIILQTLNNFRTVRVDNLSNLVDFLFQKKLSECQNSSLIRSMVVGLKFGFSQLFIFLSFTIMFYFGSLFLKDNEGEMTVLNLFSAIFAVIWPGWTSGSNFFRAPDFQKCKRSACQYFEIIDSSQQRMINENKEMIEIKEKIEFIGIKTEFQDQILTMDKLVLKVGGKQRISQIVGSYKIIKNLIEILLGLSHTKIEGKILIDSKDIENLDIKDIRKQILFIEDEPLIFQGTLRQNILYNLSQELNYDLELLWNLLMSHQKGFQRIPSQFHQSQAIIYYRDEQYQNMDKKLQLSADSKISEKTKMQISLLRALLRKPKILFICPFTDWNYKLFQRILSTEYGKGIQKIFILKQWSEDFTPLNNQVIFV